MKDKSLKSIFNTSKRNCRDSNIELLRILTMIGVIVLHYNNSSIGGALKYVRHDGVNYFILMILESIFICAVDLFILISGYFLINTQKRSIIKPLKLIVQVIVFKFSFFIFAVLIGESSFSFSKLITVMIPNNYFVILYCAVYFLSPYVNIVMKALNKKRLKRMVITVFIIFSVYAILTDLLSDISGRDVFGLSSIGMYGSHNGYTFVNFMMMYIIGAYLRLNEDKLKSYRNIKLITIFGGLVIIDVIWACGFEWLEINTQTAFSYLNPVVVFMAVIGFMIFKNIHIGNILLINNLAKGSFTVFLVHSYFLTRINIKGHVNTNVFLMLVHIFLCIVCIYLICWVIYFIYEKFTSPLYKLIEAKIGNTEYIV